MEQVKVERRTARIEVDGIQGDIPIRKGGFVFVRSEYFNDATRSENVQLVGDEFIELERQVKFDGFDDTKLNEVLLIVM